MKNFTRLLLLSLLLILVGHHAANAQCTTFLPANGQYPVGTIAVGTTCIPVTVTTLAYTGEYSRLSGTAAQTYTYTSSVATDFITITDQATNTPIAWGVTPLVYTYAAAPGDIFLYRHDNSSCATAGGQSDRTIQVTCTSCASAGTPLCTTNTAPANNATGVSLTPTITWTAATNAVSYDIYLGTSVVGATLLGNIAATSAVLTAGAGLVANTQYFWYVIPKACDGTTPASCTANATSFTTQGPPPANDECAAAVTLTPQPFQATGCPSPVSGTTVNATLSSTPASTTWPSSSDDDVWYTFTATSTAPVVRFCNVTYPTGAAVAIAIGLHTSCSAAEVTGTGLSVTPVSGTGNISLTGLTVGTTYWMRVLTSLTTSRANFDISIIDPPLPPANDNCLGATAFSTSPNAACVYTQVSTIGATQTTPNPTCTTTGNNDDVWLTVTPTATGIHTIRYQNLLAFTGTASTVAAVFYTGSCAALTEIGTCNTGFGSAGTGTLSTPSLTAGVTYFLRMWVGAATNSGTWDMCIEAPAPMTYVSSAVTQGTTTSVTQGTSNNVIIGITVTVIGALNPLSVTSLDLTTVGSTAPASDIQNIKVFYTGTTNAFSAINQFGSTVTTGFAAPITVAGTQALTGGAANTANYFWVSYDVACASTVANVLDAECTSVTVGSAQIPTPTTVVGTRAIAASAGGFDTKQNGPWDDPNTWLCGVPPPSATTAVTINHNVTVPSGSNVCGNLTIAAGKTLTINGGTLVVGTSSAGAATGNSNRVVTVNGTLTISSGQMDINGSMVAALAGFFNMSGGTLNFDANDGTSAGSATGITMSLLNGTNGSVTGGAINFLDPPYASSSRLIAYDHGSQDATWGIGCTVTIGGGDDTNISNTAGFYVECNVGTGTLEIGSMTVNGGRNNNGATNVYRAMTTNTSALFITKIRNLTVNSGSEVVVRGAPLVITGANLTNNGFITVISSTAHRGLVFAGDAQYVSTVTFTNSAIQQTWSGSGFFKKATADADPGSSDQNAVTSLAFFNGGSSSALTTGSPLSCTNLHCGAGVLNTSSSSPITIGTGSGTSGNITVAASASSTGTTVTLPLAAAWAGGWVNGPVERWFNGVTSGSLAVLPTGSSSTHQIATISFSSAPTTAGKLSATFSSTAPAGGSVISPPLTQGALSITSVSPGGEWLIEPTATSGVAGGTYAANLYANGFTKTNGAAITLPAETVMLKRPSASILASDWTLSGTHVTSATAGTGIIRLQRTGGTGFSKFAMGGTTAALPIELKSFTGKALKASNKLEWITSTEEGVKEHIIERSANGYNNWTLVGTTPSKGDARVDQFYSMEDKTPLTKSFYRLRTLDLDGREQFSNIISLTRQNNSFGVIAAYPNPAVEMINVQFNTLEEGNITARIVDMTGRLVLEQQMSALNGTNMFPVQLHGLSAGTYFITLSSDNEVAEPIRFVKQ
jgi:Secretion system C-terminal sorting domain/N-terminal domain of BNR-repeat neuraminidase